MNRYLLGKDSSITIKELARMHNPKIESIEAKAIQIFKMLENPNRKKIYDLVQERDYNIQELADKIQLSYQNTFAHVKYLERFGLVKTRKIENRERGRPRIVSKGKEYQQLYDHAQSELDKVFSDTMKEIAKKFSS